jgi:2-keto-3-deoxy-L-rhamnonate aldolase RhmA
MSGIENLKNKLKNREKIFGSTFITLNSIFAPEVFKNCNVDFMLFDCEHGNMDPESLVQTLTMCRILDLQTIVRVQDCKYHLISKCLDMGADAVLIPRTETLDQVETAISSMRFFPKGKKGAGGYGLLRNGEGVKEFNENRLLFLQIESPLGVKNLSAMFDKYGDEIAGILIGPNDMSVTSGTEFNTNSDTVSEQVRQVIKICEKYNKSVGMFLMPDEIEFWRKEGLNILWVSCEMDLMADGLKAAMKIAEGVK